MKVSFIKTALFAIALSMTSIGLQAQGSTDQELPQEQIEQRNHRDHHTKKSPEEHAKRKTQRLVKDLDLNKDQERELLAINLDIAKKMKASQEDRRNEREKVRTEKEGQLKLILTEEQYKKHKLNRLKKKGEWKDANGKTIPRKKRFKRGKGQKALKSCAKGKDGKKCCAEKCSKECCAKK